MDEEPDISSVVEKPGFGTINPNHPLHELLVGLAFREERAVQALIRDINPRLRKGCPSPADRAAHTGHWLAISPTGAGYMVKFDERRHGGDPGFEVYRSSPRGPSADPFYDPGCSYNVSDFQGGLSEWSFWPTDGQGNKLRWPAK